MKIKHNPLLDAIAFFLLVIAGSFAAWAIVHILYP